MGSFQAKPKVSVRPLPENFYIRKVIPSDAKAIHQLDAEAFKENTDWSLDTTEYHTSKCQGYVCLTKEGDKEVYAGAILYAYTTKEDGLRHEQVWTITSLAVAEAYRRKGIAENLLECVKPIDKEIYLQVRCKNTPAITLYKKSGFEIVRTLPKYYTTNPDDGYYMKCTW